MRIDIIKRVDIAEPIQQGSLQDTLFYGDEYAHRIIAEVWKNGAKADLTGAGVQGYVVRSDGVTIALTGRGVTTDDDGDTCRAYIDLLPDCYAVEGRVTIILKITGSTEITTVLALWAKVAPSYTDAIQTVTDTLPDLSDVLAKLDAVETATAAANAAAAAASAVPSVRYDVPQSLTEAQQEQARENIGIVDTGLSDAAKTALLDCFAHVAWIDEHGQTYYNALRSALYAQSYPRLTAVFNPGLHVVYTDDALDTLKPYLTVTYYETVESTGTVVAANDYTLSGTLVDGLSTVLVQKDALVTAVQVEAVDYYNQNHWTLTSGEIGCQPGGDHVGKYTDAYPYDEGKAYISDVGGQLTKRRAIVAGRGVMPYRLTSNNQETEYYPVPVPEYANKVTVTITPATVEWNGNIANYDNGIYTLGEQFGWVSSGVSEPFDSGRNKFFIVALRADNKNSVFATEPTEIIIDYAED